MTPEAHTHELPAPTAEVFSEREETERLLVLPREEPTYGFTNVLQRAGYLHEGTPLPKRTRWNFSE